MLAGKKIIIGISGSIAAYKMILLTRLLTKAGAEVRVIMTPAAKDFVAPLTLSVLSGKPVLIELADGESWANHVMLGRWADVFLVAPLSCNTLAKMANGFCDNLLLATWLSATCPVVVAPAMDEDMWHHATTKDNLSRLQQMGVSVLPVGTGALASGLTGPGRLAEPEAMMDYLVQFLLSSEELKEKRVLVTSGPTFEQIDPVRFIGNHSSGKMGQALAVELANKGAAVTLVSGPVPNPLQDPRIHLIPVNTAAEMHQAVMSVFPLMDMAIMAAAVADYTPVITEAQKIKKGSDLLSLQLKKTTDILKHAGEIKKSNQLLVGFALETNNATAFAKEKLISKNADVIIMNSLQDAGAGFGYDTNKVTIFQKEGATIELPLQSKQAVAAAVVQILIEKVNA